MNYTIYIPSVTSGAKGQAQGCILRRSLMFHSYGANSQVKAIVPLNRGVTTWCVLIPVITGELCCFSQRALNGVHSSSSNRCVVQVRWAYAMPVCVLFVCSTSGIVFNRRAGDITKYSQSAKDRDQYFKSQLYVETPATDSRYSFYRMG